jgi:hypothetical protein
MSRFYGPQNPEVAGDLVNYATLFRESGQRTASLPVLRRALAIYEAAFGPNSAQALQIRRDLGAGPTHLRVVVHPKKYSTGEPQAVQ